MLREYNANYTYTNRYLAIPGLSATGVVEVYAAQCDGL